jgi:MFS transporter, ceroid-lipofuscinosis neuronal protein 7
MKETLLQHQGSTSQLDPENLHYSNTTPHSEEIKITYSIYVIGYISFLGDMARGVIFPVLWKLCENLGGHTTDLGYLIATFSFGRMVFGPVLGYVCDRYSHKIALMIASCVLLMGAVLWSFVYSISNIGVLFVAQFLLGCGSGSLGVSRAYVIESLPKSKLTEIMAYMNSLQFAGFTISPIFGAGLTYIGMSQNSSFLEYFLPSMSIVFASVLSLYLLTKLKDIRDDNMNDPLLDREREVSLVKMSPENQSLNFKVPYDETNTTTSSSPSDSPSSLSFIKRISLGMTDLTVAYLVIILTNVMARGGIAIYETMTPNMADSLYNLSSVRLGMIISTLGCVGTLQLIFFRFIWVPTGLNDLQLSSLGLIVMAIASYLIYDYDVAVSGRPEGYIPFWRFVFALCLIYSFGYPLAQTAVRLSLCIHSNDSSHLVDLGCLQ